MTAPIARILDNSLIIKNRLSIEMDTFDMLSEWSEIISTEVALVYQLGRVDEIRPAFAASSGEI
jgi:hypothetical protein